MDGTMPVNVIQAFREGTDDIGTVSGSTHESVEHVGELFISTDSSSNSLLTPFHA